MTKAISRVMTPVQWAMLVLLSVLWGGSFFFAGIAVREVPPVTIALARAGGAALVLNLLLPVIGQRLPRDRATWMAFATMGFVNNVIPFTLIFWAQGHIASGLASILNATTPLSAIVVAHFATQDEKMVGSRLAGVLIGVLGVATMIGLDVLEGVGTHVAAQFALVLAGFAYACAGVYGRRFSRMGVPPMTIATGQVTASTLFLCVLAAFIDAPWTLKAPSFAATASLAALAIVSTAFAYLIYFRLLAAAGATNLLLVTFLIPVSAIALGVAFLGEDLEARHFVGLAVIGFGLACIDGRLLRMWPRVRKT
jgi:drug/metabolite transporter (DMT)-like permease